MNEDLLTRLDIWAAQIQSEDAVVGNATIAEVLRDAATALRSQAAAVPPSALLREARELLRTPMEDSTVTWSEDPGCFFCDGEDVDHEDEGHAKDCAALALTRKIDAAFAQPSPPAPDVDDVISEAAAKARIDARDEVVRARAQIDALRAELAAQDAASKALVARLTDGSELAAVPVHAEAEAAIKALCAAVRKDHSGISFGNAKNRVLALMTRAAAPPQPVPVATDAEVEKDLRFMLDEIAYGGFAECLYDSGTDAYKEARARVSKNVDAALAILRQPTAPVPQPQKPEATRAVLERLRGTFKAWARTASSSVIAGTFTRASILYDAISGIDEELAKLDKPAMTQADAAGTAVRGYDDREEKRHEGCTANPSLVQCNYDSEDFNRLVVQAIDSLDDRVRRLEAGRNNQ